MTSGHDALPADLQPCDRFDWERVVKRCVMPLDVKAVALILATYADPDGTSVRPGTPRLAAVCGIGERTIKRHIAALVDLGLIHCLSRGGGPTRQAAHYRLTVPVDLFDRVEMLAPDELTRATQGGLSLGGRDGGTRATQGGPSSEGAEDGTRAIPERTRAKTGENSGHAPPSDLQRSAHTKHLYQPPTPTSRSPQVSTSPAPRARCPHGRPMAVDGGAACERCAGAVA